MARVALLFFVALCHLLLGPFPWFHCLSRELLCCHLVSNDFCRHIHLFSQFELDALIRGYFSYCTRISHLWIPAQRLQKAEDVLRMRASFKSVSRVFLGGFSPDCNKSSRRLSWFEVLSNILALSTYRAESSVDYEANLTPASARQAIFSLAGLFSRTGMLQMW